MTIANGRPRAAGVAALLLLGCGAAAAPRVPSPTAAALVAPAPDARPPGVPSSAPSPLLHIDWAHVPLNTDADALALWSQIAPTGEDWSLRLREVPNERDLPRRLAIALLRAGNFQCRPASTCPDSVGLDVEPAATLDDPCLRRELALWALEQLDDTDADALHPELVALASLPPPEEELVAEAFNLVPLDHDALLLDMIHAARGAGQLEEADAAVKWLSASKRIELATKDHVDVAYELLSVDDARDAFLVAVTDAKLQARTSVHAMEALLELADGALPADLRRALAGATRDPRCEVAAEASAALADRGERRYLPRRNASTVATTLRSLCLMARAAELANAAPGVDSQFRPFINAAGVAIFDHDEDRDGEVAADHLARADVVTLPFLSELAEALEHCEGTTCTSDEYVFKLTLAPDRTITRIERTGRARPCNEL
ncbi:MAG: hypothetical protein R3B48_25775 [Kofleriaceae bacterium]